jgi:cytidylate kinase
MIVAIDGPAGAGKTTVARGLAAALGLSFLDTGAMYRAVTLACLERGVDVHDEVACVGVARALALSFDPAGRIRIDGRPGEPAIRSDAVTWAVSHVSAHPAVRRLVVALQRDEARARGGLVAEGRDIGSVVFPDADLKFYLDASAEERARRRALEFGKPEEQPRILAEIRRRDHLDMTRPDSPLVCAADAERVPTDGRTAAEVVAALLAVVRARQAARA